MEQFRGGARRVFAMRLGATGEANPGTPATYQIMDAGTPTATAVIKLTMNENNNAPYQIYLGPSQSDPNIGELDILLGSDVLEKTSFDISTAADQIANLITAAAVSTLFTLTLLEDTGLALSMPAVAPLVPGTNPEANGSQGTYQIMDTATTPAAVIRLTMLHPGSRPFNVTIRPTLADPDNMSELLILDGTVALERFTFDTSDGADQVAALIAAVTAQGSNFIILTKLADGNGMLAGVTQAAITPGTDPVVDIAAYSAAFEGLESSRWNVLAIDTNDPAAHIMTQAYLNRVYQGGKFVMGVIGEGSDVSFDDRLKRASSFNDYQIVYVGTGYIDTLGNTNEGYLAAARISGLIAGTPSNASITRLGINGAVELSENLTNFQFEQAILAGMLTFSTSSANTVWVESGVNTLVLPASNQDAGWKKIKRVKVRFELMQRLNDSIEPLIGRIDNDPDGRMTVIQTGNGVCNAMMAERKLLAGAHCVVDPDNNPVGDSAWFLVFADDIDALEKMYFTFKFRFAPDNVSV
jgi:hypothetical protein